MDKKNINEKEIKIEDNDIETNDTEKNTDANNMIEENFVTIEESNAEIKKESLESKLEEIEFKIQEIEVLIDEFEFKHNDIDSLTDDELHEYVKMKENYKILLKERKDLKKTKKKTSSDNDIEQSSPWIFLYGIAMDIFTFPFISYTMYFNFGSWIINRFIKGSINNTGFFYELLIWLIVFSLPILLFAVSWFIFGSIVKKKIDKKIFAIFWSIQGLFSLGTIIWLTIALQIFG